MNHILVPIDFSLLSEKAYFTAADICLKTGSEITLLNVVAASGEVLVDISGNLIDSEDFDSSSVKSQLNASVERIDSWYKHVENVKVNIKALPGQVEEVVLHEIKSGKYDLVVMGTHGSSGLKEVFVGSHTEHIAMQSTIPVLSMKDTEKDLGRVVLASAFSRAFTVPRVFSNLCTALGAHVTFLHIKTLDSAASNTEIAMRMDQTAMASGIQVYEKVVFEATDIESGIETYCNNHKTGLLAIESKGRTGLIKWLSGCISADLINHYEHALFTFKLNN
ncbi:MAG TPA: universal stress protein [Bacteroidia bacterium]|nr:universal stress protein [Bacteroidia bacterium]